MKNLILYIVLLFSLFSCQDLTETGAIRMGEGDISIVARIPRFTDVEVSTRGTKSGNESKVTNMYMFILDNNNDVVYRQFEESDKPLFTINRSELTSYTLTQAKIMIVANLDDAAEAYLSTAANLDAINNCDFAVSDSEDNCIDIPELGFPMIGTYPIDLHDPDVANGETDALKGTVLEIPLDCIYAKVVMNISVDPLQSVAGVDQSFQLKSWKVYNVPTHVRLGEPAENDPTEWSNKGTWTNSEVRTKTNKPNNIIYESSQETDSLFFEFYVPEHKINPKNTATYPWKPEDADKYLDYRQYLKPTLVQDKTQPTHPCPTDQKAIYVEINGTYKDHNNTERDVTYTIYLGDNNYDNFHLLRNHQYNNSIIIKGIKNSTAVGNENWVTYDHRVNVTQQDFSFGLQRETLLDCHWEIRPIRIDFNKAEASDAVVEIIVPNDCDWLSIESPSASTITSNETRYCAVDNTSSAYGKRRYYTTNLNDDLNGTKTITIHRNRTTDHTIAQIDGHDAHTVWAYIDEFVNTDYGAPRYRYATVTCNYYASEAAYNNGNGTPTVSEDYIFRQNNVFKINQNGNTYYIEYYEEYLYNYDSKEQYGNTSDGMEWGLNGVQLSTQYGAVAMGQISIDAQGLISGTVKDKVENQWNETVAEQLKEAKKYDFYLSSDVSSGSGMHTQDKGGLIFSKQIATAANIDIKKLTTKDTPQSAIEYCLNKNKRDDNTGALSLDNVKWYMPAIDEIEDITCGGYGDFEVFQDKLYWSSQPSYKKYEVTFNGTYKSALGSTSGSAVASGAYFEDNTYRARATKTKMVGTNRTNVTSATNTDGVEYVWGTMAFTHSFTVRWYLVTSTISDEKFNSTPPADNPGSDATYDEGNCPRVGQKNRVRCVYKAN